MNAAHIMRQTVATIARTAQRSTIASSSRLFTTNSINCSASTSANKPQSEKLKHPSEFISTIATTRRGDLSSITNLLGEDASWQTMYDLDRNRLKKAGVPIKERRYFLWAKEKFRQGEKLERIAIDLKAKKVVRGWGPRVQKGIRVRGRRRQGEK